MEEFPSNARKDKPAAEAKSEPKRVERVTTGEVTRRKKPLGKRFAETFVGGDIKSVASYVFFDVLIPAAKDTVADAMSQGVERMLFGEVRSTSRRGHRPGADRYSGHTAYHRMSRPAYREEPRTNMSRRARQSHDFDELVFETRVEAEEVIDRLFDLILNYETATVADLYDLAGITSSYTDGKWGWHDIRGADVTRVRNGYLLDIPRPEPI